MTDHGLTIRYEPEPEDGELAAMRLLALGYYTEEQHTAVVDHSAAGCELAERTTARRLIEKYGMNP